MSNEANAIMIQCPICGAWLKPTNRKKHLRKVHGQDAQGSAQPPSVAPAKKDKLQMLAEAKRKVMVVTSSGERLVECPLCRMPVWDIRLIEHVCIAHPEFLSEWQVEKRVKKRSRLLRHLDTWDAQDDTAQEVKRQQRDAQSLRAGTRLRQSDGRFHSLPLEDDYGDESDANSGYDPLDW